jgi:hypothetical protein
VQTLIQSFLNGTTQQQLTDLHQTSVSSVKRLLRAHDARLWVRR